MYFNKKVYRYLYIKMGDKKLSSKQKQVKRKHV